MHIFKWLLPTTLLTLTSIGYSAENKEDFWQTGCKAARHKILIDPEYKIQGAFLKEVKSYRQAWDEACAKKSAEVDLAPLIAAANKTSSEGEKYLNALPPVDSNAQDIYVSQKIPQFLPLFVGSIMELQYLTPALQDFSEIAKQKGTEADRKFFEAYITIGSDGSPSWVEQTWDYGGCVKFGEYDWNKAFALLESARDFKAEVYRKMMASSQQRLMGYLKIKDEVCTCKSPAAVAKDFASLIKFLDKKEAFQQQRRELEAVLKLLKAKKIKIKSDEKHECSYG